MLEDYFEKFGHKCPLASNKPFVKFEADKTWFQLWFMRNSIISQKLILFRSYPRTFAKLRNEILHQLEYYPYALHPFSYITFYCELIWMVAIFVFLIAKPINLFFFLDGFKDWHQFLEYYEIVCSVICIFDCIRRFFTGYLIIRQDKDEVVLDFKRIAIHYLTTFFFIDLLSTLSPFVELFFLRSPKHYVVIQIFSYLKICRLGSIVKILRNVLQFYSICDNTNYFYKILQLAVIVHWVACLSVMVGIIEHLFKPGAILWFDEFKKLPLFSKYITCLHRTVSLLSGTGYYFSINHRENLAISDLLYTVFTIILGHVLTLIIVGVVSEKVFSLSGASSVFEAMSNEISQYLKHQHLIQATTQDKIKSYYEYKYHHSCFNENAILGAIPNVLRQNILLHNAKLVVDNVELFQKLPAPLLVNVMPRLGKEILLSGDIVFHYGDKGDSIMFINSGTVASFTRKGREIGHFEEGSYFGELSIVGGDIHSRHITTNIAIETTELFELKAVDYFEVGEYYPDIIHHLKMAAFERIESAANVEERYEHLLRKKLAESQEMNEIF